MNFKKLIACIMAAGMSLSLCACGGGTGSTKTDSSKNSASKPSHTIHMDDDGDGVCDICGESLSADAEGLNGWYTLSSKTVDGTETKDNYLSNTLFIADDEATVYEVDYEGKREIAYECLISSDAVTLKQGFRTQKYVYDEEASTLTFSGRLNGRDVEISYKTGKTEASSDNGDVSFTDELFGDDINENFYNYCPSVMLENSSTMHIWYCSNKDSGNVTDYIAYRKGTLHADGKWSFTEKQLVLQAGDKDKGEWDSRHACDPSVVKGTFSYNGENYSYLMAYLGCETSNGNINEVGIALAKAPQGPWVKYGNNPIANYRTSVEFDANYWGYGQPSLVSVDKAGKVILFYTKGVKLGTYTQAEMWDLSNLNAPVKLKEAKLADGGAIETFNNADFAYSPASNSFFCVKEDHVNGWYPSDGGVNWISGSVSVFYNTMSKSDVLVGDSLFNSTPWAKVGTINQELTGYARNHNAGLVTDPYGWLIEDTRIPVVYTMSRLSDEYPGWSKGGQWPALHTYRLHGIVITR